MADEVALKIGKLAYGGWTEIAVTRSMEVIAGAFELTVTERWPGQQARAAIAPGDACELTIGGETIITGWVDEVEPDYDATSHHVAFRGRDATGDLVDCSALNSPGVWTGASLLDIATEICKPFHIGVRADVPTGSFAVFALQQGETAFEAIERMATRAGVLPVSDGHGGLVFTRSGVAGKMQGVILGENILKGQGHFSNKDRYSQYIVLGQSPGGDYVAPAMLAAGKGEAFDKGITRYRPLIVMANVVDANLEIYRTRAQWEATVRMGRAWRHIITVQGWRDSAGVLWRPNCMTRLDDDFLGIHSEVLISGVRYMLNDQGTLAELTLTRREAFDTEPMPDLPDYDPAPPQQRMFPGPGTKGGQL